MPSGKAPRYLVDNDWRNRVETRLVEKGWNRADLSRNSGVGKSTISDLLNGKQDHCEDLPQLHKALEWAPPLPPILSHDAGELIGIWDRLDDFERGRLLERARSIYEQHHAATPRPPLPQKPPANDGEKPPTKPKNDRPKTRR